MNAYIASQLQYLTNTLTPAELGALASLLDSGSLSSVTSLDGLPSVVQSVVRDAFRDGVRWCFVSLVPWLGVGCVLSVFLSRIWDSDEEGKGERVEVEVGGGGEELGEMRPRASRDVEAGEEPGVSAR